MCNNNNNAGINKNCRRLQNHTVLFKIPYGRAKKISFEIYRQFFYGPSKKFASLGLDQQLTSRKPCGHYL